MRSDVRATGLVISAVLGAACASTPSMPQTPAAAGVASAATGAPAGDVDASLVKQGYSVMRRHGEVLYCRTEIITGGRIGTRICLTAGQIQEEKLDVAKARDMMNTHGAHCVPGAGDCAN